MSRPDPSAMGRPVAPGRVPQRDGRRTLGQPLECRIDVPTCGSRIAVETRRDPAEPLSEPFGAGTVQSERRTREFGGLRGQRTHPRQQVGDKLGALRLRTVADRPGEVAQRIASAGQGSGIVQAEASAQGLEPGEHLGCGGLPGRLGRAPRQVNRPGGHGPHRA